MTDKKSYQQTEGIGPTADLNDSMDRSVTCPARPVTQSVSSPYDFKMQTIPPVKMIGSVMCVCQGVMI